MAAAGMLACLPSGILNKIQGSSPIELYGLTIYNDNSNHGNTSYLGGT